MANLSDAILVQLRQLKASWPARGWSYDGRFECVATSFGADFSTQARALLQPLFPQALDERSIRAASGVLQGIAERTGGLRAGQLVLGGVSDGWITPYVLWWPWEEAATISIRVGLEGAGSAELDALCACFATER